MKLLRLLVISLVLPLLLAACTAQGNAKNAAAEAVTSVPEAQTSATQDTLVGDAAMNQLARYYAGIDHDGLTLNATETAYWNAYSSKMGKQVSACRNTLSKFDTLMSHHMQDLRQRCDYVFYPFSGADFLYPITLFPQADTYFLAGLEPAGSPLTQAEADPKRFAKYTSSLLIYMRSSFFRTKSMQYDLNNDEIDGTVPVLSMLMGLQGYQIVSVGYKVWTAEGAMRDTAAVSNLAEIRFFHPSTPTHLQTLYYLSGDISDKHYDQRLGRYLANTLPRHYTVTYLKAASYLLHQPTFKVVRGNILNLTRALIGDDSGMPYRYLKDQWDISLFGKYQRPISLFSANDYQADLDTLYKTSEVHPLNFRIGYNRISNLMCARKR